MNPFGQIIDLTAANGIEPGKIGPGLADNVDPLNPGVDFLTILGGKLSGELPLLFGEVAEAVGSELDVSGEILSDKPAEQLLLDSPEEFIGKEIIKEASEEIVSPNNLIDPIKIGSEQFLKNKAAEANNNIEKPLKADTIVSSELDLKVENLINGSNKSIVSPELKINNQNLNSNNLASAQID